MLVRSLLVIGVILAGTSTYAADDVSGRGSVYGGSLQNESSDATVVGGDGRVMVRFSENFGIQADAQLARISSETTTFNQQDLTATRNTLSDAIFSTKIRAGYIDPNYAFAIGAGTGSVSSRNHFNGGIDGLIFFDNISIRSEASIRHGERQNTVLLGTLGADFFPIDNLMLSLDGSYGQVVNAGDTVFANPFLENDTVLMASASADYRFEIAPLGLGIGYGYFTSSPDRGGDVHVFLARGTVYFGSTSIRDERQTGALFGRNFGFLETFLDGLL
ncbi:MAG: hypothetical protein AAFN27_01525 [Pseudomonadota bacterium]